jgi:hypothetical protein
MKRSESQGKPISHTADLSDDAAERIPPEVVKQAKAAFRQPPRGELAALVWDSLIDEGEPGWHHHLGFEHPQMWIDVTVSVIFGLSTLRGVLYPAVPAHVELHRDETEYSANSEVSDGAFSLERIPRGLVRLRIVRSQRAPVLYTDWFRI